MNPNRMREIEMFLANPGDPRFGPGNSFAYPRPEELAQYDTIQASTLAVDTQAAPPTMPAGGDQQLGGAPIATSAPPAPVPISSDGQALIPAAAPVDPMPVDPNISPVTGRPRSMFSQQRRAQHDQFMEDMANYQAGMGSFPGMGPRPTMPGQPAPAPDFPMGPMPRDPNGMPMRPPMGSRPPSMPSSGYPSSMMSDGPSRPMQNSFPSRSMPGQSLRPESSYSPPPSPMPVSSSSSSSYDRPRSMPRVSGSSRY